MVAFSWLSQVGRFVGISCFRNFTVVHILGIWVSEKQLRPCNNGFGGLDCSRMWRNSLLVAQFANMLRIWTRYHMVCYSYCLYHVTSLSTGQWILSRDCLTLMGIMHFWFAWISLANCVDLFHAWQGKMSWVLLPSPNYSLSILCICMMYRVLCSMTETKGSPQCSGKNCGKS